MSSHLTFYFFLAICWPPTRFSCPIALAGPASATGNGSGHAGRPRRVPHLGEGPDRTLTTAVARAPFRDVLRVNRNATSDHSTRPLIGPAPRCWHAGATATLGAHTGPAQEEGRGGAGA